MGGRQDSVVLPDTMLPLYVRLQCGRMVYRGSDLWKGIQILSVRAGRGNACQSHSDRGRFLEEPCFSPCDAGSGWLEVSGQCDSGVF